MEKLLIYYILNRDINLEDADLKLVTNPLSSKILRTIIRLTKRESLPTFEGLRLLFKEAEHKSEALKLIAYLDVCAKVDTSIPPDEVLKSLKTSYALTQVESDIAEIAESAINKDIDALTASVKSLQKNVDGTKVVKSTLFGDEIDNNNIASVPNSFATLNDMGCQLSALVIIGAPSGGGKSMFVVNQMADSLRQKIPSAYFSLEMPIALLQNRFLSNLAEVELSDLMQDTYVGKSHVPMPEATKIKVDKVLRDFREGNIYGRLNMYDNIFDVEVIKAEIKRLARTGTKLFCIDYLGLINFKGGWVELKTFVIELNQICLEYGVVILLPTQVTIEKDSAGAITMTTKGSVEIFNSATLGMLLYQTAESKEAGLQELIVVKSRNGEKPKIALERRLNNSKYIDLGLLE